MDIRRHVFVLLALFALVAVGCGSDDSSSGDSSAGDDETSALPNACPADGCQIGFKNVEKSGDEISVEWELNFSPEFANNHIHIYWDLYDPGQVSGDAADRGLEQGEWVPTDVVPVYVTEGAVSTSVRADSTTLCVVAADRDHNVIDEAAEVCRDVSEFL